MISRVKTILFKCRNFCSEFLPLPSRAPPEVDFWKLWENWIREQNGKKEKRKEQNALPGVEKVPTKDPSCAPGEFDSGKRVGQMISFQPNWPMEILGASSSGSLPLKSSTQRTSALLAFENRVKISKTEKGRALDKVIQVFCTGGVG